MSYFPGVYITQYHKSRAGYFINHDLLMNGTAHLYLATPSTRNKLIFYYIAENVPQKLNDADTIEYHQERYNFVLCSDSRLGYPITFWTYAAFFGIFGPTAYTVLHRRRTTAIRDLAIWALLAGYFATAVNATLWRTNEARMIESSEVVNRLVEMI